ncbi:stage II sporulation protein M [Peribacillus alkalitolerans]|uniref:stage II sporulation protein M n=1 Tax=Peribacillus alkalitolerans TaxID=1550385 RepID=UPI0013D37B1F|nr:stage II sporulation protein M [Peribacillus alkalitolerans]
MKKKSAFQNVAIAHFNEHSSLYVFIIVLFLMGVIFGAVIVNSLSFTQKEDLFYYLGQFFGQVSEGNLSPSYDMFLQSLQHNMKYIVLIWILGVSIIGIPVILILLFLKGMVVGFTVGFLVNQMGWSGFGVAFVSILPQNILIVPVFIFITTLALSLTIKIVRRIIMKNVREPLKPIIFKYVFSLLISFLLLSGAAAIEAYFSPPLMKTVIGDNFIKK